MAILDRLRIRLWEFVRPTDRWNAIALAAVLLGLVLVLPVWITDSDWLWLTKIGPCVQGHWIRLIGIYILNVGFSMSFIAWAMKMVRRLLHIYGSDPVGVRGAAMVGIAEAVLYPTAWLIGLPQAIAVWLALKATASRLWHRPASDKSVHAYLIGNCISLLAGAVAYGLMIGFVLQCLPDK